MYVLIREYVDVHINYLKRPIYDFEKYVHMVWRIRYQLRMHIIHMIWTIQRVDRDELQRMDISEQTFVDRKG
jgi:hypothetical protein